MSEEKKVQPRQEQSNVGLLVSFLAGAAIAVGIVLLAESKSGSDFESYGEADLFV